MFIDKPYIHYRIDNSGSSINNISKKLPFIDKEYDKINRFIANHNLPPHFQQQSDYCRSLTYVWATEQLHFGDLRRYLHHISPFARRLANSDTANLFTDQQLVVLRRIAYHPGVYAARKVVGRLIH